MDRTGCYTPDGQHRMQADKCTVCLRSMVTSEPTPAPEPEPTVPVRVNASPRVKRIVRRLVKWAVVGTLAYATFTGCSDLVDGTGNPAPNKRVSECYTDDGIGPTETCVWTGKGRDFVSYNHGLKIVYVQKGK